MISIKGFVLFRLQQMDMSSIRIRLYMYFLRFSNKRDILNFRVMAVRDIELRTRLSKNIYLSRDL